MLGHLCTELASIKQQRCYAYRAYSGSLHTAYMHFTSQQIDLFEKQIHYLNQFRVVEATLQMDTNRDLDSGTSIVSSSTGEIVSAYTAGGTSTTDVETTIFQDAKASEPLIAEVPHSQTEDLDFTHSIIQILNRPTLIMDFNINTIGATMPVFDNARLPLRTIRLPWDILRKGAKILKVANFEYIKCNMVIKIMTNANPFVAGRYWICFSPYEERKQFPHRCVNKTRAAVTSYPGVELDLQLNNSVTVKIPWVDVRDNGQLSLDLLDECQLHIFNLTQLLVEGDFNVNMQIFGWLEDVELRGPTSETPIIAATLQVAQEAKGPISEIASTVGSVATVLSGVPVIGDVAKAVSWVSSAVGGVASLFGYSKPVEGSGPQPIVNIPARSYGHTKASDMSVTLALANDNAVSENDMNFMTEQDEMSVEYISSRPGVIAINTWLDTAVPNAVIAVIPVGPQVFAPQRTQARTPPLIGTSMDLTNFEYLASHFGNWRADLCFRISVVKTPFHTGRIEVAYVPGASAPDESTDLTNCYRQILDLNNDTEMLVTVPYVSPYPMMRTTLVNDPLIQDRRAIGTLVVRALSPLIHPPTVSSLVQVVIWKWATNVALACPTDSRLDTATELSVRRVNADLQIGVGNVAETNPLVVFGRQNSPTRNIEIAQMVCGELLVSSRALTRAYRLRLTGVPLDSGKSILRTTVADSTGGYVSRVAELFCFWRGGLGYKFYSPNIDSGVNNEEIRSELTRFDSTTTRQTNVMSHRTIFRITPYHEVTIPFYSTTRRQITNDGRAQQPDTPSLFAPSVLIDTNVSAINVLVAGKDDMNMGFLYGCGPQYQF